jgi:tRNA dimethylallyltransferase
MNRQFNKIIAIVGPTATGKSDLAVEVARYIRAHSRKLNVAGAEVLSADSRQVYRHLNIGSGKITKKEMCDVPHHMLDVAHPSRVFTVAQYQKKACAIIKQLHKKNIIPILCGGTGMYIDAILTGEQYPAIPPDLILRRKLERLSTQKLFTQLQKKDPRRASTIDPHNRRRLIRALEILAHTRSPIQERTANPQYETLIIGINPGKEKLQKRIAMRLSKRIRHGMIAEVRNLHDTYGVSYKRLEALGLEYRYIALLLQNKMQKKEALEKLQTEIWRYSKRQMTWFKRDQDILWISKPTAVKIKKILTPFSPHNKQKRNKKYPSILPSSFKL